MVYFFNLVQVLKKFRDQVGDFTKMYSIEKSSVSGIKPVLLTRSFINIEDDSSVSGIKPVPLKRSFNESNINIDDDDFLDFKQPRNDPIPKPITEKTFKFPQGPDNFAKSLALNSPLTKRQSLVRETITKNAKSLQKGTYDIVIALDSREGKGLLLFKNLLSKHNIESITSELSIGDVAWYARSRKPS